LENVLREKEAKWAETEKATERKNELLVSLQKMKEEDAQVRPLTPLSIYSLFCVLFRISFASLFVYVHLCSFKISSFP
jgi:hypothetical protein